MGKLGNTDVAVIGAGPYGLSLGAHLKARGVPFRIFGRAMGTWRENMPQGMYLKSEGCGSSLSDPNRSHTLKNFSVLTGNNYSDWGLPVPIEQFIDYGHWFQKELVPELDESHILNCRRNSHGFLLHTESGEALSAKSVIVSTGYCSSGWIPDELVGLPGALVSHSSAHQSFDTYSGKDVAVIGAGQSALESAALLKEAGASPSLLVRCPAIDWGAPPTLERTAYQRIRYPRTGLGDGLRSLFYSHASLPFYYLPRKTRRRQVRTFLGPFGAWWLRNRVVDRMPILTEAVLRGASERNGRVALRVEHAGKDIELEVDHVLAATGYHVSSMSFPFLSPELRQVVRWDDGSPVLSRFFESSVPGLHFIGLASAYQFGPVMRFVAGVHVTAPRLGAYLERQLK